ncbi:hypothetical protein [Stratiformator vulcanicus]|uniref:Uncharacterized protein n=1 Tax=Stratiformator vulcanicus TaxID=2527980 RepID=A0A517QYB3_9PLAN|nr:hypothetical protein [Stratiformator vulcanicus]QDT36637.1 hypothetical protein Pan189_09980 [Stratiformator vulcanicus]
MEYVTDNDNEAAKQAEEELAVMVCHLAIYRNVLSSYLRGRDVPVSPGSLPSAREIAQRLTELSDTIDRVVENSNAASI